MERAESIWRPLGELLVEKKLLTEEELELALTEQAETGRLLGAILVERGYVSGPALAVALAEQYGVELHTERGFGTGLWAEIDRRHRAGRGHEDNVVKLEAVPAPVVAIVRELEPDPELDRLEAENRRLQDEIERLRGEFTKLKLVETTQSRRPRTCCSCRRRPATCSSSARALPRSRARGSSSSKAPSPWPSSATRRTRAKIARAPSCCRSARRCCPTRAAGSRSRSA